MKAFVLAIMLMLIFVSVNVNAQNNKAGLAIGPQLGFQKSSDSDEGRMMYGAFIRAKLSPSFAIDGSINYRNEHYLNGRVTVSSWPVLVSALLYPFPMVYGLAGVGWYNSTFNFSANLSPTQISDQTKSNFGWHLGAGVELPLGESMILTGDIKYVFLNYNLDNVQNVRLGDLKSNFFIINVGLGFGI